MSCKIQHDESFDEARRQMIDQQLRTRGITDPVVLEAMGKIPREAFLPPGMEQSAYDDRALSVGCGQTISQPYIVAYMTEKLSTTPACRVLEIGTGTGYQTAILAKLVTHVFSVERVPELHRRASEILDRLGVKNVSLFLGDGTLGLSEHAPFDRIIITAGAPAIPPCLANQLVPGGILLAPVGNADTQRLVRAFKRADRLVEQPLIDCRFVKLIGQEGWRAEATGDS